MTTMNPTLSVFEPPVSPKDEASNFWKYGNRPLAPGVMGTAFEEGGLILIPLIVAEKPGNGNVGRFLDRLSSRCRIISVTSDRLAAMLYRRQWVCSKHEEYGDIWKR